MSRSLDDLHPDFRALVDPWLASCRAEGIDILVTCTRRTLAEQQALYDQGRTKPGRIVTNAKPGQSAHNFGLAVDVVPLVNGKPVWDAMDHIWQTVGDLGMSHRLEWLGAPHSEFVEMAHFQFPRWRDLLSEGGS